MEFKVFCVLDKTTGRLLDNITTPQRMCWKVKGHRDNAIERVKKYNKYKNSELVPLDCVLIPQEEYNELKEKAWQYYKLTL